MRMPTRLHITWQDDNTLKIETDAGQQTRRLRLRPQRDSRPARRSLQGYSAAEWERRRRAQGRGQAGPGRQPQGRHQQPARRLAAQERRALQRERGGHRVLRPLHGAERRRVVHGHDDRRRSDVPEAAVRDQLALQEGAGRRQVVAVPLPHHVAPARCRVQVRWTSHGSGGQVVGREQDDEWNVPNNPCRNERRMPLSLTVILVVLAVLSLLAVAGYLIDRSEERQERGEKL